MHSIPVVIKFFTTLINAIMWSRVKKVILVLLLNCCVSNDRYGTLGCSDLCNEISLGPRCACERNFLLGAKDNETCNEVIFYNEGRDIFMKTRTEEGDESTHALPIVLSKAIITGLSLDIKTQSLFISDAAGPMILEVDAASPNDVRRELVKERIRYPADIAFDWTSNNLYWVDSGIGTTEVVSTETLNRTVLVNHWSKPISLALSPCYGVMFIATSGLEMHETSVTMYRMDGKHGRILHSVQGFPVSLALHPSSTLLFWSDPHEGTISYVNFFDSRNFKREDSESDLSRTLKRGISEVMSVTVSEREVLYTLGEPAASGVVNRLKLPGHEKDAGWRSITSGIKFTGKSECLIENGGCHYLCLTSEYGGSCACPPDMTLSQDGKSCFP